MPANVLLKIEGMTCEGCAETVQRALERDEGVEEARVSWETGTAEVTYDPSAIDEERIVHSRIFKRQYRAAPISAGGCC